MALIQETITINDKQYLHTYSDANCFVLQTDTGISYGEAIDPINNPLNHSYVEGDPIPPEPEPEPDIDEVLD